MAYVYDVHCHIQQSPGSFDVLDTSAPGVLYCPQGTNYTDWASVAELKDRFPDKIVPAFGLHPWFIEQVVSGEIPGSWATELKDLIVRHNGTLGECGLDKVARNPATNKQYPFEPQLALLKQQLALAHELDVPASLHCVKAYSELYSIVKSDTQALPPRIMLHSYSGSPDMLSQMFFKDELAQRMYVSFSAAINGRNLDKTRACIKAVPLDRLLVESDLDDARHTVEALDTVICLVADTHGMSVADAKVMLARNSQAFLGK
ncbi:Cut9-interacting protein scn1 [Linderina pennispora]|nr:Cut9-interacting protein scn1 [Linderina pennispora]